ncbi:MAG: hypothetical protein HRT80_14895 [Henriciella sp.]|nr:hypothetical protein [Henriciella sp.]
MSFDPLEKETDFKFISRLQEAKTRAEDFARYSRAQSGLETGDGSSNQTLLDGVQQVSGTQQKKNKPSNKDNTLWLDLIQRQIDELQTSINDAERDFAIDNGEEWRELFALRLLDPELMPQRLEDESLEEYRARVEQALIDEPLNDDGSIKDEYKDHPEYGELAQWAQWKHDQQLVQTLNSTLSDPSLSGEQRGNAIREFTESATHERVTQALTTTDENSAEGKAIDAAQDSLEDQALSKSAAVSENAFLR